MKLREEEFYEQYHQHGGTTIIPTEIFNELYDDATEEIERLNNIINKAIEYIEENEDVDYNPTLDGSEDDSYMKLPRSLSLFNEGLDILLNILKGVDKE